MVNSKYGKYIVTDLKHDISEASWVPPMPVAGKGKGGRILFLDSEVVPGAFYVETVWEYLKPTDPPKPPVEAHTHDFDEVFGFFGTDLNDPYNLNGEIELWLGDEKHTLTRSCLIFVPKGLRHSPLIVKRTDKPIFEFTTGFSSMYQ
ncbi:MAG: hypothetical protein ACFFDI_32035 [Promethearchaeota archaeon]